MSGFDRELRLLSDGTIGLVGQIAESSNFVLAADLTLGDEYGWAIYKPQAGEQPLHDFPPGLHVRERAAFLVSEHLGWHVVPPTVIREDAPAGVGSLQWFLDLNGEHYFTLFDDHPDTHDQLRRIAVFDFLINNTDRKSGHVLQDESGRIWGIDHGLCFNPATRLRTVIWDFQEEEIAPELQADLERFARDIPAEVTALLSDEEAELLQRRADRMVRLPFLPRPWADYQYPWPLV
ncbi:SCO1664 family protein [Corynebacterium doosanense]|uniref:Phosphatidylinositol kinase n=1 Tax=Corynebacterium doosanense CAU 212 = DSM 45436 TaxID=558173 RepID=A0A097IEY4_9CORY|nr:SCO1664 family protein [Corynebacterium doosanense]AIT60707.1 phosphatidylinositol kinase [Corynebacterium doosanense CAU 212 = DSM 45436]